MKKSWKMHSDQMRAQMKSQKRLGKVLEFLEEEEDHHWPHVGHVEGSVCFAGEKRELLMKRKMEEDWLDA